ncbi:flagellar basal body-associated FliL family protein [bacterium]|nr:flagellar basal body-associated FliL family protein [bacterium]
MENPKKQSILPKILQIFALVLMAIFSLTGLAAAYIIFAPDNLPKPFYLQYNYPTTPVDTTLAAEGVEPTLPESNHTYVAGEGIMINTGSKIINLSDPLGRKYIRITVVMEFAPEESTYFEMPVEEKAAYVSEFTAEVNSKLPIIDDAVVTLISSKTFEELYTAQGKENLRMELSNLITQRLPEYHILSVYLTEFVVQ